MMHDNELFDRIVGLMQRNLGEAFDQNACPPPAFVSMGGEFVALDLEAGVLVARFPILPRQLNPYGMMQGGIVAAAVDNTLGPLSLLLAPPNVTRRLEMTYSHPVRPDMGHVLVEARCVGREGRRLTFRADVRSPDGQRLARAKAVHWVIDP